MRSGLRQLPRTACHEPFRHRAGLRRQDDRRSLPRQRGRYRDVPDRGQYAYRRRSSRSRRCFGRSAGGLSAQFPRLFPRFPAAGHSSQADRGHRLQPQRRGLRHPALLRRVCRRGAQAYGLRGAQGFPLCRSPACRRASRRVFDRRFPPSSRSGRGQARRTEAHHHPLLSFGKHQRAERRAF